MTAGGHVAWRAAVEELAPWIKGEWTDDLLFGLPAEDRRTPPA